MVKVLQIEMTLKALAARGIHEDMVRLEREGVEPVVESHGLKYADLAIKPCKLFYRRRVIDMPLSDVPPDAPPKRQEAMRNARAKILEKAMRKFLFEFQELRVPTGVIAENGQMVGVKFSRTEVADGQVRTVPDTSEEVRAALTISSIGSIPEPIPGVPQKGEVYQYRDLKTGLLFDGPTAVFAAGNVLTGKGNIKDSLESGTEIGTIVAENYLGLTAEEFRIAENARLHAEAEAREISAMMDKRPELSGDQIDAIRAKVRERQKAVGYDGNYRAWIAKVTPSDLQ